MNRLTLLALLAPLAGCALVAHPRPTPAGVLEVEGGLGGPLVNARGVLFPAPIVSGGVRYGVSDRFDLHGHVHLVPLVRGGAGVDLGSTVLALEQDGLRPALSATARAYAFTDFQRTFRPLGELALHASWLFGERWLTYASASGVLEFGGSGGWSAAVGEAVTLGAWTLHLELRAYAPTVANQLVIVEFPSLLGAAPVGAVFGVGYRLGEERR